jgi:adenylate kinase family enzyme
MCWRRQLGLEGQVVVDDLILAAQSGETACERSPLLIFLLLYPRTVDVVQLILRRRWQSYLGIRHVIECGVNRVTKRERLKSRQKFAKDNNNGVGTCTYYFSSILVNSARVNWPRRDRKWVRQDLPV